MGEHDAMCEKILRKIEHILITNREIREFAVIPTPENEKNKSPILYEQNCLAVESWCKKYLLQYTHSVLHKNRKGFIEKQLPLESLKNLNHILIGFLLIQPNETTYWNMKRELVKNEILNFEDELYFSRVVLTLHSKCIEIFSYRRWLINEFSFEDNFNFEEEFRICESAAEKAKNNYHAWNHRVWCLEKVLQITNNFEKVICDELYFSLNWISKHISENSGYYYRQVLIRHLNELKHVSCGIITCFDVSNLIKYLKLPNCYEDFFSILHYLLGKSVIFPILEECPKYINILAILLNDIMYISNELNYLYKDHECLWNYRKFLIMYTMQQLYDYHGVKLCHRIMIKNVNPNNFNSINIIHEKNIVSIDGCELPKRITSSTLYRVLMRNEIDFIECNKNIVNTVQINFAWRHLKWLKCSNFFND